MKTQAVLASLKSPDYFIATAAITATTTARLETNLKLGILGVTLLYGLFRAINEYRKLVAARKPPQRHRRPRRRRSLLPLLVGCALLMSASGCGFAPQKGGRSDVRAGAFSASLRQSENPKEASEQTTETETVFQLGPDGKTNAVIVRGKSTTRIGGTWKDTAREIAAKLKACRPVQILGVLLILASLAMFHPVVKAITMSRTLQAVTGGAGLFLVFAPVVIVGHEGILIAAGIAIPAIWFFVHRHGKLQAIAGNHA